MKATPHPDKGGEAAPVLKLLPPMRYRASRAVLDRLYSLRIQVERELAAGPWDDWDGQVLEAWLATVKEQIRAAWLDLEAQHPEPVDYERGA